MRKYIRLVGGRMIGYVEEDGSGNKTVYGPSGAIVGKYTKSTDTTYDFYGRIIAFGDVASGLLLVNANVRL